MSARPGDWFLLQLSGDPFPGDENAVARQAGHYRSVADAITDQIANLRKISNGDARGQYVDKLVDDVKDIANDLSKVENRFSTVASQLKVWQPVLAEGRTKSAALLRDAEAAKSSMSANHPPSKPLPDDASDEQVSAEKSRDKNYSAAQDELSGFVRQMQTEIEHVRSVAHRVAGKINDASSDDVEDSWWDAHVRKWIQDHADLIDIIVKVLEIIAIVIAVVALVLATGGFGAFAALGMSAGMLSSMAAVATTLEVVGAVLSGAMLLGHAAEMFAGVNDAGWGDIAGDVISLVSFGASRAFTSIASKSFKAANTAAKNSVTDTAVSSLSSNVTNALRIGSETNPLRVWAAGERATAINAARQTLTNALDVSPSLRAIILAGGKTEATMLAQAKVLQSFPTAAAAATRAINATRGGIAFSIVDDVTLVDGLVDLPGDLRELVGGSTKGGG